MREDMHARRVEVAEPRTAFFRLPLHEIERGAEKLLIDRLHALPGERSGVLDCLLADLAELFVDRQIVLVCGLAFQHAARPKSLSELRVFRVVLVLGFLFGVQMIEIAEEFVESVNRGQMLVAVAKVILAELAGCSSRSSS